MGGLAQEIKLNISGYVKSSDSGETLIGANVVIKELNVGCTTNNYGFFSFTIEPGTYKVETSYIGYNNEQKTISKSSDNIEPAASFILSIKSGMFLTLL